MSRRSEKDLERQRQYNRVRRADPVYRARERQQQADPAVRARKAQKARERNADPEVRERHRLAMRKYNAQASSRERYRADRLLRLYGLGVEVLSRMLQEQGGLCAICRENEATHVDHNHRTKQIRGVLCHSCNSSIGHFMDDPIRLRAAADYLEQWAGRSAPYEQAELFEDSA